MKDGLLSGADALAFFYAVFWALVFNASARYRVFDTHLIASVERRWMGIRRIVAGAGIINFAPLLWFMFLYRYIVPHDTRYLSTLIARIASFSLPGFNRILHSIVLTSWQQTFYDADEAQEIIKEWRRGPSGDPNSFSAHFVPGVWYLSLPLIFALLLGPLLLRFCWAGEVAICSLTVSVLARFLGRGTMKTFTAGAIIIALIMGA